MTDEMAADVESLLIARLRDARDASAFDQLYRRHNPSLYAVAARLCNDPEHAEDVVHDAWVRAVESLSRFEQRSRFRTWITGILLNRIRELWRAPLFEQLDESALVSDFPDVLELAVSIDIESAVRSLPAGFRTAIVLHDVEGYTHEEIAAMTGVSIGTSKSQLARARHRLRSLLGPAELYHDR